MNNWLDNSAVNPQGIGVNNNNNFGPRVGFNFQAPLPHYQIIEVSGENGVDAFQMGPNSSVLIADITAPIVWLVRTDSAGYKYVKVPYDITPHQAVPPVDVNSLEQRVKTLEDLLANGKQQSNSKQSKRQSAASESSTNSAN